MQKIILATQNRGKVNEFRQMLADYQVEVLSLIDLNYQNEIEETGSTFTENALIKARAIATENPGVMVIADDSGLAVDALSGKPGVYSARYAGTDATDDENIDKLLAELQMVETKKRSARFVCVLVVIDEKGKECIVTGTCEGQILSERRGTAGFGYDPIFYVPKLMKTTAEMDQDEKSAISHRGQAFAKLVTLIGEIL